MFRFYILIVRQKCSYMRKESSNVYCIKKKTIRILFFFRYFKIYFRIISHQLNPVFTSEDRLKTISLSLSLSLSEFTSEFLKKCSDNFLVTAYLDPQLFLTVAFSYSIEFFLGVGGFWFLSFSSVCAVNWVFPEL